MKTLRIIAALVVGTVCSGFAQSEKLQSGDSIRVELERTIIFKELTQLRDSMNQSLLVLDSRVRNAKGAHKIKLEGAKKELAEYRNRVKLDLEEASLTAKNSWTNESVERIRLNTSATRKEYQRLKTIH
jgi:hypothetical protein